MLRKTVTVPSIISIGQIIRDAYVFNFKNWRTNTKMNTESLLQSVARLFTLLQERQIEYVLVGGIAMLQYIEGRNDINIIITLESMQNLPEVAVISQDVDFVRAQFDTLQLDCFLTRNPLFNKVRKEYVTVQTFMEQTIPCATVEGLLLMRIKG
jgi:hypothetical protein